MTSSSTWWSSFGPLRQFQARAPDSCSLTCPSVSATIEIGWRVELQRRLANTHTRNARFSTPNTHCLLVEPRFLAPISVLPDSLRRHPDVRDVGSGHPGTDVDGQAVIARDDNFM